MHLFLKADYTSCFLVPFVIKKSSRSVCNPSYNKLISVSLPKTKKTIPPSDSTSQTEEVSLICCSYNYNKERHDSVKSQLSELRQNKSKPTVVAEWLAMRLRIQKTADSTLWPDTNHPQDFRAFFFFFLCLLMRTQCLNLDNGRFLPHLSNSLVANLIIRLYAYTRPAQPTTQTRAGNENCTIMGYNAASSDNFLPTFRGNIGPIFRVLPTGR
jgi:hypothetical protein